jgi:3',5'-cyclic-AMP phosphodiesterase
MRIAHISDLHLDDNNRQANLVNAERLLEHISLRRFDHVIVSGDITENAEDTAFELARRLFKKYGLLDSSRLSVIIGNHDIFGGVHLAEDVLNFPSKCRETDFDEKVEKFCYYFRETFENTSRPADNRFLPFIKELDEVVLIGLNSIAEYSALKNPFASNGKISSEQLRVMNELLLGTDISDKRIIAATHHHFCKDSIDMTSSSGTIWQSIEKQTMKLRNRKRIIKKLKKAGVELVLHGHLHESSSYLWKDLKFLNAGGSILGCKKSLLKLNEIVVNKSGLFHNVSAIESETKPAAHYNELKTLIYTLPNSTPQRSVICMN